MSETPSVEKDAGADVALAMFRRKYGREPVPESFDQSRLADCRETVALIWPEIAGVVAQARAEGYAQGYRAVLDYLTAVSTSARILPPAGKAEADA